MTTKKYLRIVNHYETCLQRHGDNHLGVDWPNVDDVPTRYQVMLDVIRHKGVHRVDLLDFGCGASHFYEYLQAQGRDDVKYSGLDISPCFIDMAKRKYPSVTFYCLDILENSDALPLFDFVVMNGVFTEKCSLSYEEMLAYFQRMLVEIFSKVTTGIAFNVMSKHVDWERDDLFHLPFDTLARFLTKNLSRNFVIRNDYGLYEYTTYVYK